MSGKFSLKEVRVQAKFEGVLPTSTYANMRPGYLEEEVFMVADGVTEKEVSMFKKERKIAMQAGNKELFEKDAEIARVEKVQNDLKNFRFYDAFNGEKWPSVTSIMNYDKEWKYVTDEELRQYASQGNMYDAEIKNYVKTGVFKSSAELLECAADRFIVKTGSKKLSLEPCAIVEFLKKYPIDKLEVCEKPVYNHQYRYAGIPDLIGVRDGKKILISVKRTKNPDENAIQEAAYSKCGGMEDITGAEVWEFKNEADGGNKCGFSKPTPITNLDRAFEVFLYRRADVKKIYGV